VEAGPPAASLQDTRAHTGSTRWRSRSSTSSRRVRRRRAEYEDPDADTRASGRSTSSRRQPTTSPAVPDAHHATSDRRASGPHRCRGRPTASLRPGGRRQSGRFSQRKQRHLKAMRTPSAPAPRRSAIDTSSSLASMRRFSARTVRRRCTPRAAERRRAPGCRSRTCTARVRRHSPAGLHWPLADRRRSFRLRCFRRRRTDFCYWGPAQFLASLAPLEAPRADLPDFRTSLAMDDRALGRHARISSRQLAEGERDHPQSWFRPAS